MKKKLFYSSLSIIITLFSSVSASAQSTERVLTLEDAYRSAIVRSETMAIARENLIQSEDEVKRTRSFLFPSLKANLDYLRRPKSLENRGFILRSKSETGFDLTLSQPLYTGGRAQATYKGAQLGEKGERLQVSLAQKDLLFEIAKAYYLALKAKNNVLIEEKEVERLTAHRRSAEKQLEVGEITKTALFRAEAELSNAQANLIRAKNALMEAQDELALLARIEEPFTIQDPAPIPFPEHPESEWIAIAYENRIELKQENIRIDQADENVAVAQGGFLPSLSLELQYRWADQDPQSTFLISNDRLAILKLEVPIFEGMVSRAELAQARSRVRQSHFEKNRRRNEIASRVRQSRLDLFSLTSELKHLEDQVRFAREAFSLASRQFEVGLGTPIEVLDANSALLDAERKYSNTIYDREMAILQIKKDAGLFSPLGGSEEQTP